jgi:hypothetical protein
MGKPRINFLLLFFLFCAEVYSKQELAVIKDPDGFVNVRLGKSESSPKLFGIGSAEIFVCEPTNEDWWHVKSISDTGPEIFVEVQSVGLSENIPLMRGQYMEGFMHKSRVSLLKDHPLAKSRLFPTRLSQIEKVDRIFKSGELVRRAAKERTSETTHPDELWFKNDSADQEMWISTGTDYMILHEGLYSRSVIPQEIDEMATMEVNNNPEIISLPRKKISKSFFVTERGLKLGDSKEKAIRLYGKPTLVEKVRGYDKLEWDYVGLYFISEVFLNEARNVKQQSYDNLERGDRFTGGVGEKVMLFFKDGKLAALVILGGTI